MIKRGLVLAAFEILFPLFLVGEAVPQPLTLEQVLARMGERDQVRSSALAGYTCLRRYTLQNHRFHVTAEIAVRMTYSSSGAKTFDVLSTAGPTIVRQRVLRRMIDAELEASRDENRPHVQITPQNYDFQLLGTQLHQGRPSYLLAVSPKTKNKFLIRGRIWVDGEDFAIVRVEASPAQKPSALIHNTSIVQQYSKWAPFWLPLSNDSRTDSYLFGWTEVSISYSDYQITQSKDAARTASAGCCDAAPHGTPTQ